MNVEFINPFLKSITNILSVMAQTEARAGRPVKKEDNVAMGDVTGIIGMAGQQAKGSLAITFTEPVILHIAGQMLGEEVDEVDESIGDMVGEITNMVTGGAKRLLSEQGYKFDMAVPTTILGKNHIVSHKTSGPIIIIPFDTDSGKFFVEVCFEM